MRDQKKLLIVEPVLCAHSVGYFRAILANDQFRKEYDLHFLYADVGLLDAEMLQPLRDEFGDRFQAERMELSGRANGGGQLAGFAKIKQVLKRASLRHDELGATQVAFLNADFLIKWLGVPGVASGFSSLKGKVTGVFFNSRCLREKTLKNRLLKRLILRGVTSGLFKKVLFLDHGVIETVKKEIGGLNAPALDPAVDPWSTPPETQRLEKKGPGRTFLCFGAHSVRKGTLLAMETFSKFPERFKDDKLLVAGPVREDIREEFYHLVDQVKENGSKVEVIDRYFEDQESWSLFERSDIVLCPYVDFHGSSNVIIRAAAYGLPVVAPSFGFLGEVVSDSGIGEIYRDHTPEGLSDAVKAVEESLNADSSSFEGACRDYAQFHSEGKYAPSLV